MSNLDKYTTAKLVGFEYTSIINNKIELLKSKLEDATRNRKIYEKLILINKDKVYPNDILSYVSDVYHNKKQYNKFKIIELFNVKNGQYRNKINSILYNNVSNDEFRLIYSYYVNFMEYSILESNLDLKLEKYERLNISSATISYLFKIYFWYISIGLLRSRSKIQLPYNVNIRVYGKNPNNARKKYNNNSVSVDWGESLKVLINIAKEIKPDLYNAYINKNIKKKDFIQSMKPYVYNKELNPNGKKWIVKRDKDFNLWIVIWSRFSNLKNIRNYSIIPTNFIATKDRSQIQFANNVKSIDDIITSRELGFRDKLRVLERYDINYCLNTFDNDL